MQPFTDRSASLCVPVATRSRTHERGSRRAAALVFEPLPLSDKFEARSQSISPSSQDLELPEYEQVLPNDLNYELWYSNTHISEKSLIGGMDVLGAWADWKSSAATDDDGAEQLLTESSYLLRVQVT